MNSRIITKGLNGGSFFKLLFIGNLFSFGLFIFGLGCASFLGYPTMSFNHQIFIGFKGLGISLIIAPLVSATLTSIFWLSLSLGLWIWTRFSKLELYYRTE